MTRSRHYAPSLVLAVVAVGVLLGGPKLAREIAWADQNAKIGAARAELHSSQLAELSNAFREVGKVVEPSVVHISVSRKGGAMMEEGGDEAAAPGGQDPNDLLRKFFRDRFKGQPQPQAPGNDDDDDQPQAPAPRANPHGKAAPNGPDYKQYDVPEMYGSGSGWIYEDGKHIITNNHVVKGADEITVKFFDKTTRRATVVGTDPQTDIAVLEIKKETLLHGSKLAREVTEQGDMVFAFGSPFQFEFSMSQGIVSGKGRRLGILGQMGYEDFIQTDAAINPGNSGGPLTNIYGEVVGMNTAIATRTGSYNGLGFAIPASMIKQIADQIIGKGKVSRGYLGVYIQDLDEKLAKTFAYKGEGVLVEDFASKESPAAKAGLKAGDIITHVNDQPVRSASELRGIVALQAPDATIDVKVFREGKALDVKVKLMEQPGNVAVVGRSNAQPAPEPSVDLAKMQTLRKLGFEKLTPVGDELAAKMNLDIKAGVLVEEVRPGSVAFAEGLRPGVVLTQVGGQDVTTVTQIADLLDKQDLKDGVRFRIHVQGVNRYVLLALPE
jgi:serine protease Do